MEFDEQVKINISNFKNIKKKKIEKRKKNSRVIKNFRFSTSP